MRHHQAGDLAAAEEIYREVLQQQPENPLAMQMLGVIASQRGQDDLAIDMIRRSIQLNPTYPGAYRHLAPLLAHKHQFDEAIAAYEKYLELRPNIAEVHRDLGTTLAASGQIDRAIAAFSRSVQLKPDWADAHHDLGQALLIQGKWDDAVAALGRATALKPDVPQWHKSLGDALVNKGLAQETLAAFRRAVQLKPDFAAAHVALGNILWQMGRLEEAIAAYSTAIQIKPDLSLAYLNLGQLYHGVGRNDEALLTFQRGLKINADDAEILPKMIGVLADLGRYEDALAAHAHLASLRPHDAVTHQSLGEIFLAQQNAAAAVQEFRRATEIDPKLESAWNWLGRALQSQGKFDEAAKCYRYILDSCPGASIGLAYGNLIQTGKKTIGPRDIERLTAAVNDPNLNPIDRIGAGFALGKMLDDAQRYDEAFACYAQANLLDKQLHAAAGEVYEPEEIRRHIDDMVELFTPEFFAQRRDWGETSEIPVFIVGMPRSGTTLVHQIAASHPQVHGAGELTALARLIQDRGGADLQSASQAWGRDEIKKQAGRHLQYLRSLSGTASRIIDKMPNNIYRLDLIFQLFPSARVIFCYREARDNCLSCFFQRFAAGNVFACDLADCGYEYLAVQRLTALWRRSLPLRMLEVQYEDLAGDLEGQSRRLIEFLGLSWDPACLEFHRAETAVQTASSWQVRQPIYQNSIGRWRHYERHMGPLMAVLSRQTNTGQ